MLACPGLQKGHVKVELFDFTLTLTLTLTLTPTLTLTLTLTKVELFDITRTTIVPAHESSLGHLATNLDGTRLATASERGTLVRVWDTKSGQRLHELRCHHSPTLTPPP